MLMKMNEWWTVIVKFGSMVLQVNDWTHLLLLWNEKKKLIWPIQWWSRIFEIPAKYTTVQIVFNIIQYFFTFTNFAQWPSSRSQNINVTAEVQLPPAKKIKTVKGTI